VNRFLHVNTCSTKKPGSAHNPKVRFVLTQDYVATLTKPCLSTDVKKVLLELLGNGAVVRQRDETGNHYCLFGNTGISVSPGMICAVVNGIIQPKPVTFTLAGTCKL
jgi:hypothetical protein